MSPILTDINSAMSRNETFSFTQNASGNWEITKPSVWHRILFWKDGGEKNTRVRRIAKVLNGELKAMERMAIKTSMKSEPLKVAGNFLQSVLDDHFADPNVNDCCRQLLAAKLGIETQVFGKNPGFEQFAIQSRLEQYLADYDHEIKIDPETLEISLLCDGKYQLWSEISTFLNQQSFPEKNHPDNPRQEWFYGNQGVQKKDLYTWRALEPYKTVTPTWGDRYLFEFCVSCKPSFSLRGDHSWLELKTPEGNIYSTGLHEPAQSNFFDFLCPLKVKKGSLMSPDFSNWQPTPVHRIPVEITKGQFKKIKQSIEEDKQKEKNLNFQSFKYSCTEYVIKKAALADIQLNTSVHVFRHVVPIKIQKVYDGVMARMPALVHKIFLYATSFFLNLIQCILGATFIDKEMKQKDVKAKPCIRHLRDLFKPSKLHFHPPRRLGLTIRTQIEKWRDEQRKASTKENPQYEGLRYALLPEFRTQSS